MRRPGRFLTLSCLSLGLLSGCLTAPAREDAAEPVVSEPATRGGETADGTGLSPRLCKRVWSAARADSVWNCPDPSPPSAP